MDEDTIDYEGETVDIDAVYDVLDTADAVSPKSRVEIGKRNVSFRFDPVDDPFGGLHFGDRLFSMGYVEEVGDRFVEYINEEQTDPVIEELEANEAVHQVKWENNEKEELFVEFDNDVDASSAVEIPDGWSVKHVKFYHVMRPDMVLERDE